MLKEHLAGVLEKRVKCMLCFAAVATPGSCSPWLTLTIHWIQITQGGLVLQPHNMHPVESFRITLESFRVCQSRVPSLFLFPSFPPDLHYPDTPFLPVPPLPHGLGERCAELRGLEGRAEIGKLLQRSLVKLFGLCKCNGLGV